VNRRRVSLRTRLVVAMLVVALGVLGLSYLATFGIARRAIQQNALTSLRKRSTDLATIAQDQNLAQKPALRRAALKLTDLQLVVIGPRGTLVGPAPDGSGGLPAGLTVSDILPKALVAGDEVSGRRGNTVFLAIPTGTRVGRGIVVVVATDTVDMSVLHRLFPLLLLAGLVVLGLALAVATWLARRLTRPIREIENTARQLATGDLTARAAISDSADDELGALARTLNHMAAELEHARGAERAFLMSISHDLRTPLTSIRGYAEALADGTLDEANPDDRKRAATVIGAEARRLERLVRDLLDLSRLDTRQFSLNPHACDAAEVVRDAAAAFAPQAHDLGVALSITGGGALPVELDAERLAQIVANLVENALKYASGRVEVYAAPLHGSPASPSLASLRPHEYGDGNIAVVVTDDGPGIPADQLALVFDRLYTVRETPARAVGTGLGLAIVRELAAAMGGRAWAENAPDGGSRFVVSLPIAPVRRGAAP
jgi:two-component system, OmpR family, sensor kinase